MIDDVSIIISIADIHFGRIDPKFQYETLVRDFINVIDKTRFDIVAICGDIFDCKMMSNNPAISYALRFMSDLVKICKNHNASIVIVDGTPGHDQGQNKLFYKYLYDKTIDFHIAETIKFEYVKGLKILCIPEKYGIDKSVYEDYLYNQGLYDLCLLHGTYKGSYKDTEVATLSSNHAPIFCMNHFINCCGPILMGHYHVAGCYDGYAYYNGSALRFQFGEEQEKGFMISAINTYSRYHYTELIPIKSHSYITINIDDIINNDPQKIVEYIKKYKESHNIDYIRIQFNNGNDNTEIVRNYFKNTSNVSIQELKKKDKQNKIIDEEIIKKNNQYNYLFDDNMSDIDKLTMYINQSEGYEFITADELINLLEEDI